MYIFNIYDFRGTSLSTLVPIEVSENPEWKRFILIHNFCETWSGSGIRGENPGLGIYKGNQESTKERKHACDQESDQE